MEENLNWNLRLSRDNSRHWIDSERVSKVWASLNAFLGETEAEWNMLLIDERDNFLILTLKQEWTEFNLTGFEKNVWLIDSTDNKEMLSDVLSWNSKDPL